MNVLISNDDGYLQRIAVLALLRRNLPTSGGCARNDRSGVSNCWDAETPLQLKQAQNGFYYVNRHADRPYPHRAVCIFGFSGRFCLSHQPGREYGDDTLYSGTAGGGNRSSPYGHTFRCGVFLTTLSDAIGQLQKRHCGHCWRIFQNPQVPYFVEHHPRRRAGRCAALKSPVWAGGITVRTSSSQSARRTDLLIGPCVVVPD